MKKINEYKKIKFKLNLKIIFLVIIFIILIYNVLYQIFGVNIPFVAETDMMKNDINKYDVLFLKKSNVNYEKNDIVVFKENNQTKIAKVIGKKDENYTLKANQNLYYIEDIKGINIIGKVTKKISLIGIIFVIFRSKIITFIFLIIFLINFIINERKRKNSLIRKSKKHIFKNNNKNEK